MIYVAQMINLEQMPDGLMTTAEVAKTLGVSIATVNRRADTGQLTVAAKGRGVRGPRFYDPAEVDRHKRQLAAPRTQSNEVPA